VALGLAVRRSRRDKRVRPEAGGATKRAGGRFVTGAARRVAVVAQRQALRGRAYLLGVGVEQPGGERFPFERQGADLDLLRIL
jgi:hypothetical protein